MAVKVHSVSSITKYNKCPALYALHYKHGIREEDRYKDARDRGTCVHAGLEAWLRGYVETAETRLEWAKDAARRCSPQEGIEDSVRDDALEILEHYIPLLPNMKPYMHEGKPVIEFEFESKFPKYGDVSLQGKIDAVVILENGDVALLDWKVRKDSGNFYREYPLQVDRQIPVYAAVLKHVYHIPVTKAFQVQMSAVLPATPNLLSGKKGNSAADYGVKFGKTTAATLKKFAEEKLPEEQREGVFVDYFDKVTEEKDFLDFTEINLDHVERHMHYTLLQAKRINEDKHFLPILDAYVCKFCPVIKDCKRIYIEGQPPRAVEEGKRLLTGTGERRIS